MNRVPAVLTMLLVAGCASVPRPALLTEVDSIRDQSERNNLRTLVPQADARAEKFRSEAEAAWPKGHTATAEILAERALVAYADLRELARIVRTEQRLLIAKAEVHQAELDLLRLESDQKKAAAEAADYEVQLRVEREVELISAPKPSTPDREQARLVATRTTLAQARLLCVSAHLLGATGPAEGTGNVSAAIAELDALETKAATSKTPAPVREAILARSRCLQLLTEARRPVQAQSPTSEKPDQLFVELAQAGFSPIRDDHGIVVTLNSAFTANAIDATVTRKLADLGRIAEQHADTPLLVVTHSKSGEPKPTDQQRGEAAALKLREAGAKQLQVHSVGGRLPVARNTDLGAAQRNERLDVIFVTRQ